MAKKKKKSGKKKSGKKKSKASGKDAGASGDDEHGTKDISSSLKDLDTQGWGDTDEASFGEVPDGQYEIRIESAVLNHSKSSSRFQCSWTLKIAGGDQKGRNLFKHDGMEDEVSRSYFRGALARLGVEWPESASKLPGILDDLKGTYAAVTVRTKAGSEFQNVYFNKALDSDEINTDDLEDVDAEPEAEGGGDDEWEKGHRCVVEIDGEDFAGEIASINKKKQTAMVKFDDGDKGSHALDNLKEEEGDGDDAKPEGDTAEPDAEGIEITFNDENVNEKLIPKIKKLAEDHDFEPDDYESWADLLCDVGEYLGVTGSYDTCPNLLEAIEKL